MDAASKARQSQNDAAEQQPWRCTTCQEPVGPAKRHCACTRAIDPNWGKKR